tara:strand:+ start:23 stop:397 length:375 start_codon:yes stop_codon:yes gene_type:complete
MKVGDLENRTCKKCGKEYLLTDFPINNTLASGILRKHTCKYCRAHQSRVRAKLHRENKRPESITCPVCESHTHRPVMDHCHKTDTFRGWICNDCNNALGKFNDSVAMLKKAIEYLGSFKYEDMV